MTEIRFFARATDTSTGTIREQVGPFDNRESAEQAALDLVAKWTLATTVRVIEREQ